MPQKMVKPTALLAIEDSQPQLLPLAGPVGGEVRANSFTTGTQNSPAIAVLSDGSYVVAWTSAGQDGSGEGIYAQRFAASGTPAGSEFRVTTTIADDQRAPALAALSGGGFVITWETRVGGADSYDIRGQRYDSAGLAQGSEFPVNQTTTGFQGGSAVASSAGGGFIVTWQSFVGSSTEIFARRFNADGSPAASEFQVNSFTTSEQDQSSVAMLAGGGFVVTWQSENQDGSSRGVYAQLYNGSGAPIGSEFRANTTTANLQGLPSVTALEGGGFVIVWGGVAVRGQIYAADGTPIGGEIPIATGFNGVSVTAMAGGGFAVTWDELASPGVGDGAGFAVVARAFNASGQPLGDGPVVINETVAGDQRTGGHGSIHQLADGSLAIVWAGNGTGDTSGVFVRRYDLGGAVSGPGPIVGTAGPDTLTGTTGDDVLRGLGGNDVIDGLGGTDIAEYLGLRSNYRVTVANGVYTIDDQREGAPDGTDTLTNVEQLRFGDGETVAIADAVAPATTPGATPLTGAMLINATPETGQIWPMTVALTGGGYAVVWLGGLPLQSSSEVLVGRAFNAAGQPVGDEFTVGAMDFLSEEQVPTLTALAGGGFAVAWMLPSDFFEDTYQDLQVQIYDATGAASGPRLNLGSTGRFSTPVLVGTADGGFLVIRDPEDGTGEFSTTGQFFNSAGTAVGSAFPIGANVGDSVSAAFLTNGDIAIAWNEPPQEGGERAFVRLFGPTGQPRGDSFVVDTVQLPGHNVPSVAALAGGGFVMTWFHNNPDADIYARIFDAAGNPVSATLAVNESTAGTQWYGYVEALDDGGFVISWTGNDGNGEGVFARVFDASGQPRGGEFLINAHVPGNQEGEIRHLAQLTNGDLIFSWTGAGADGTEGVFTRRYTLDNQLPPDTSPGTAGNDTRIGTPGTDVFRLEQGGDDIARGGAGDDGFFFGGAYTSADLVDGGAGTNDQIGLQGNYSGGVTLGSIAGVEMIVLLPGDDDRFGGQTGTNLSYNIVSPQNAVGPGQMLTIQANTLRPGENLTFDGSAETDGSFLIYGGAGIENLIGGAGNDGFFFGQGRFGASDLVNGGGGTMDQLGLQGNFSGAGAITFGAGQLIGVEYIVMLSASDNRFGSVGGVVNYDLTMNDGNVAAGQAMVVQANTLGAGETLRFVGTAETNGSFRIYSGAGADVLIGGQQADEIHGGAGADIIRGAGGADTLYGAAGSDVFQYLSVGESTAAATDQVMDFASGDRIDLAAIATATGSGSPFTFIGGNQPGGERQVQVIQSGSAATVNLYLDGDTVADMVITLTVSDSHTLTATDFVGVVAPQGMAPLGDKTVADAALGLWLSDPEPLPDLARITHDLFFTHDLL